MAESMEIPGIGTGYLADGKVVMVHEGGALSAMAPNEVTMDTILTGWRLATEAEADSFRDDPGDIHRDKDQDELLNPPAEP